LLKRARALIGVGNIAGARRVLERAASTKDGPVLFALAETYDPAMLAQWGVVGMRPDAGRARALYEQALEHGIGQARERLAALP
jgi:TPR repeat protein